MNKIYSIIIYVSILMLGVFSTFVYADAKTDRANTNKFQFINSDKISNVTIAAVINPEILDEAQKLGIDTSGLTSLEIKMKVIEAINAEFRVKAKNYGIDTTNLSDEQVRELVLTKENAETIAKAKKAGVKTDGLTYSEVMAEIERIDRENARKNFGINTDGLTYNQVILAVQEQIKKMVETQAKITESMKIINYNKYDQPMNDLIISAKALGVAYEGLSYEELYKKVVAGKGMTTVGDVININNNKNIQPMEDLIISAKALGISYEGLSYDELYAKIIAAKKLP